MSHRYIKENICFQKSILSKQLSPTIYSIVNDGTITIEKTKFTHLLKRAVKINEIPTRKITFDQHGRNVYEDRLLLKVMRTVFSHCHHDKRGAALYVRNQYCLFFILHCGFTDCISLFTNGGIFFQGRLSRIYVSCFTHCVGQGSDFLGSQAFTCKTFSDQYNTLNHSTIEHSSPLNYQGYESPAHLSDGKISISNVNFSDNHVIQDQCAVLINGASNLCMRYISYCNNTGNAVIKFIGTTLLDDATYMNFIDNWCHRSNCALLFVHDAEILILASYFVLNYGPVVFGEGRNGIVFHSCIFDYRYEPELLFSELKPKVIDCLFDQHHVRVHQLMIAGPLLCWNDCGLNEECASHLQGYFNPPAKELGITEPQIN